MEEQALQDLILRYGVLLGKRSSEKQKLRFLRAAKKQLEESGFAVDITKACIPVGKQEQRSFYNLYAGDLQQAKIVLTTYYDTGCISWHREKPKAFASGYTQKDALFQLFVKLLLLLVLAALLYVGIYPFMRQQGIVSLWGLLFMILVFGFFYLMKRYREGIPKRKNMIRNSSSLIALFTYLKELPEDKRARIAVALVDEGTRSAYGLKLLQEYLGQRSIIRLYMDSIANPGAIHCFSERKELRKAKSITLHPLREKQRSYGDILMSAGECENGEIVVQEKEELREDQLKKAIQALQECVSLLLSN